MNRALAAVAALTAIGLAVRAALLGQTLFGDELSTWWVVTEHTGLAGVWDIVHTDAEITPPLYFLAAKATTQIAATPEMLRLPSLIAGTVTIPLVYWLGLRTVGRRAALLAAAFATLSPFLIFYSTEARTYALMIACLLASTIALLRAVDEGDRRAWVAYAAFSAAAMYSHYTVAFALAAQAAWALWAHPEARRAVVLANVGAAVAFLPWLSGAIADRESPTTEIASVLLPFGLDEVTSSIVHWAVGFPYYVPLSTLPGYLALGLLGAGLLVAAAGRLIAARPWQRLPRPGPRLVLVLALAVATPLGEAAVSAVSTNLLGARNLAASWPALALLAGALIAGVPRPALRMTAAALALVAFAISASQLFGDDLERPDYAAAAAAIEAEARPADVVIENSISPGPRAPLELELPGRVKIIRLGLAEVRDRPPTTFDPIATPEQVAALASAAAGTEGRIFLVGSLEGPYGPAIDRVLEGLSPRFQVTRRSAYAGYFATDLLVLEQ